MLSKSLTARTVAPREKNQARSTAAAVVVVVVVVVFVVVVVVVVGTVSK